MSKIGLIVIDGQIDFCEGGNLAVPGANDAMKRVADMIDRIGDQLESIDITLDADHGKCTPFPIYFNKEIASIFSGLEMPVNVCIE